MKTTHYAALLLTLAIGSLATAQEVQVASSTSGGTYTERQIQKDEQLRVRLASLEQQVGYGDGAIIGDQGGPVYGGGYHGGYDMGYQQYGGCQDCGVCNTCCDCKCGQWVGGVGVYFVQPVWSTNPAFYVGNGATPGTSTVQTDQDFDWGLNASPYVTIGYVGADGFGVRSRYWMFDQDENINFTVPAGQSAAAPFPQGQNVPGGFGPGTNLLANHSLDFDVVDLELTYESNYGALGFEGAAGVRYMEINQDYRLQADQGLGTGAGAIGPQAVVSSHSFSGVGASVFGKVNRRLGCSGTKVFASARESLLVGDRDSYALSTAIGIARVQQSTALVSMTEVEMGFDHEEQWGSTMWTFELSVVGQLWTGVGNGVNGDAFNPQRDQAMGLFGGRASLGFDY